MQYVVYVLFSESLAKYYVGQTKDIENRLDRHNSGRENYTSKGTPWNLICTFNCKDRQEAVRLESRIKKRGIQRYLQDNNLQ